MKKKLLLLAMGLFAAIGTMKADDVYFSVEKVDVMQGKSAKVTIYYDADGSRAYRGAQIEFIMPEGITVTKAQLGPAIAANNPAMTLGFTPRRASDSHTVLMPFQMALQKMPTGKKIELCTFYVTADKDCKLGEYPVETAKIAFVSDENVCFEPRTIIFKVNRYAARVLEDTDEEIPASSEVPEDVIVNRHVKANVWSTLCLPFEISRDQLVDIFGPNMFLAEFVSTEVDEDKLYVNFDKTYEFEANHPYLLKSEYELTEFAVTDVLVSPDEVEAQLHVDNGRHGSQRREYGIFHGTLRAGEYYPEQSPLVYIKDNKFYYNPTSIYMNAFRGYFEFEDFDLDQLSNILYAIDDEPTSIEGMIINGHEIVKGDVYHVNGTYMGHYEDVKDRLPRGVYIINKKKVIVK